MNFVPLIEQAGLHVVTGQRRAEAALGIGHELMARDQDGNVYRIVVARGSLVIEELPGATADASMLLVKRADPAPAGTDLSDSLNWKPTSIPHTLGDGRAVWAIRESELMHLMSVWIGATYVSVHDAAKRTGFVVRPIGENIMEVLRDEWDADATPHSTNSYHGLWAIREADLLKLFCRRLHGDVLSVADGSATSGILVRPVLVPAVVVER